jgi:GNAT superfamily N-acetyltransferase
MSLPADLAVRVAGGHDLPAIAALRRAVGWAVHDWALRAVIDDRRARCLVVTDASGSVVGVGSGIVYGALGFVGNMVVAEEHRRRGVGAAILETILAFLRDAGTTRVELYATPAGRPLYARFGFAPIDPGAMAHVPRAAMAGAGTDAVERAARDSLTGLAAYDAPRFGGDRSTLLAMMLADPERPVLVARRGGEVAGYAWLRPDADRIGPFVADDPSIASELLAAAFAAAPDVATLTANLPMANRGAVAWLGRIGVELSPWDGRMGRGPDVPRRVDTIFGNAVGALG